jgi:hypothetical protein
MMNLNIMSPKHVRLGCLSGAPGLQKTYEGIHISLYDFKHVPSGNTMNAIKPVPFREALARYNIKVALIYTESVLVCSFMW